jgi:predicted RND superfamily exporter protein
MSQAGKQSSVSQPTSLLGKWVHLTQSIEHKASGWFGRIGRSVGNNPWKSVLIPLLVCLLLCGGLVTLELENDGTKLWTPQETVSKANEDFVDEAFGAAARFGDLFAKDANGGNVLTIDHVRDLFTIYDRVANVKKGDTDFTSVCLKYNSGACVQSSSVLKFWRYNSTLFAQEFPDNTKTAEFLSALSAKTFPSGEPVWRPNVFSSATFDSNDTIQSAKVLNAAFIVSGADKTLAIDWEREALDYLAEHSGDLDRLDIAYQMQITSDDELAKAVGGDVPLFVFTFIIMTILTAMIISSRPVKLRGRIALGNFGVLLIFLATGAAYGLCALMTIKFSSIAQILPFIIVGVGVDDMLIVCATWDKLSPSLPSGERMSRTLASCGVTVAMTSITNVVAFLLGSATVIPAVQWFCWYAAASMTANWLVMMTAFAGALVLDGRRQAGHSADCFCCASVNVDALEAGNDSKKPVAEEEERVSASQRFFRDRYAPFILNKNTKIGVAVFFTVLFSLAIWGVTEVEEGFDIADLAPDGSYMKTYYGWQREDWDLSVSLGVYTRKLDFASPQIQRNIIAYTDNVQQDYWAVSNVDFWFKSFHSDFLPGSAYSRDSQGFFNGTTAEFQTALDDFLAQPQFARFADDVERRENNIIASKGSVRMRPLDMRNAEEPIAALQDMHDVDKDAAINRNDDSKKLSAFTFFQGFVFFEQFVVNLPELLTNFGFVFLAVFLITIVLLVHPTTSLLVVANVVLIDVELLASLKVWGLKLDSISSTCLIMAVGLVVDYSAHLAHSYMQQSGTDRNARVAKALAEMGSSIALGGLTTFCGVMSLAAASSEVFRTFFKMFVGIIILGILHGLVLLPVLLSWIGPTTDVHQQPKNLDDAIDVTVQKQSSVEMGPSGATATQAV